MLNETPDGSTASVQPTAKPQTESQRALYPTAATELAEIFLVSARSQEICELYRSLPIRFDERCVCFWCCYPFRKLLHVHANVSGSMLRRKDVGEVERGVFADAESNVVAEPYVEAKLKSYGL